MLVATVSEGVSVGVEAEYGELFAAEYPGLVRELTLLTGDIESARDAAQEAFSQLYVHWRRVSRYDRPGAWIRRVGIRAALRSQQRDRRRRAEEPWVGSMLAAPEDVDLSRAIDALPPMQRAAIVLHYLHDLPVAEVADLIGCRTSTASVHLHRARKRLADLLGEEDQ